MFDSHAHILFDSFDLDRETVIARAREIGLIGWMEVGTDLKSSEEAIALAVKEDGVWASVGVHPSDIGDLQRQDWHVLERLAQHQKVKAIGEVGLDFFRGGKAEEQLPILNQFISLAQSTSLPVIFHVRDGENVSAHEELLALLSSYSGPDRPRGVIHTYSGTLEQAKKYLDLGMYLSFSGVVTFKNAGELLDVAKMVPSDRYLLETDSPFLAPMPHRGKRNEPAYVKLVAEKMAEIRGVDRQAIEGQTDENALRFFDI